MSSRVLFCIVFSGCLCKSTIESKRISTDAVGNLMVIFCVLVRMENSVLGNALEGVPEESEEEEQPSNSNIECANNLDG